MKARLAGFLSKRLVKDTMTMSIANVLRLLFQAAYFVAIARALGSEQYGEFVAITAIVGVFTPFAGLGSPSVLLKSVSRDKTLLSIYWGNGLFVIFLSGSAFSLLLAGIGPLLVGNKLLLAIACISVSDLILGRIVELASFAFTALGRMTETALLNIYISLAKLLCVFFLSLAKPKPTVEDWCAAILCGSVVCASYSFYRIAQIEGTRLNATRLKQELFESTFFAVGNSAATFYNDIDKTMLARLSNLSSAGIYGAAYRIVDVSMAPIRAMAACAYAEFFRRGVDGPASVLGYAKGLIKRAALFGIAIYLLLTVSAPALPLVLGSSFRESSEALRWLAIIPLLRAVHLFLADALSGCGFNRARTIVQVIVALINIGLNFIFIREWSWRGAAWTSIMCDTLLILGFAFAFGMVLRRRHRCRLAIPATVAAVEASSYQSAEATRDRMDSCCAPMPNALALPNGTELL